MKIKTAIRATFALYVTLLSCTKEIKNREEVATSSPNHSASLLNAKPNIILIVGDDFGYEIPTYTGGQSYRTPNLDMIAHNGVQFTNCYSHPDGSPSRLALMTGKYNFRNYKNWGYLPSSEKTLGNLLQSKGYATCFVGKWQLDGGAASITNAGFDKYRVFIPYSAKSDGESQKVRRYKSPKLYENGAYLPDAITKARYSEDMFNEYARVFIDNNKNKPFFLMYDNNLVGRPFVPTPDNPEFDAWNPEYDLQNEDTKYFPSMVAYMDKMIGKLIKKLDSVGLTDNTLILFTADNPTPRQIISMYNGEPFRGTKNYTTLPGTHVPLLGYLPGRTAVGIKDTSLVDFTDFLPTLADAAVLPRPTNYGTLDGITFYDNLLHVSGKQRQWIFCQWDNNPADDKIVIRHVHDYNYKLYDSVNGSLFYKIKIDPKEKTPLDNSTFSNFQKNKKTYFQSILDSMH